MKLICQTLALALTGILASTVSAAPAVSNSSESTSVIRTTTDESAWVADYDKAVELAKAQGKDLLVDFTGSDWCPPCMKLDEEVFSTPEFITYAKFNYILVALDFPKGEAAKARVPNPARNQELAQLHEVAGFPSILLMTSDGVVFGRTGYAPGGSDAYILHLADLRKKGRRVIELSKSYEKAEGAERHTLMLQALEQLEGMPESSPLGKLLVQAARDAMELDLDNAKGLRFRALKGLLNLGLNDDDLSVEARKLDPKNEGGLLELGVLAKFREASELEHLPKCCDALDTLIAIGNYQATEKVLFMLVNAAIWNQQFLKDLPRAKKYAKLALNFEMPLEDADAVARLQSILDAEIPSEEESHEEESHDY